MNKHQTFLKNSLKTAFFLCLWTYSSFAQDCATCKPVPPAEAFGPTLIIASNASRDRNKLITDPKAYTDDHLPSHLVNTSTSTVWTVGVDMDSLSPSDNKTKSYKFLDKAINQALVSNYQTIIILEGEYEVNGPIIINYVNDYIPPINPPNAFNLGRITIEGEGFGTRIRNATSYTGNIFEVRSYFNTIKNLSIISSNANTCLALTTASSTVNAQNNVFENLYMGNTDMAGSVAPVTGSKGITLNSSNRQIGYNRFKNITFNGFDVGVELQGQGDLRIHDNHFENLVFDNTKVGIEFLANSAMVFDNVFDNISIETDSYTTHLVKNINGRHNSFTALNHNKWNEVNQSGHTFVTVAATADHTTIQNSEVGRGTTFLNDQGFATQLINNFGKDSEVTYKLGNPKNTNRPSALSFTEILGRIKIAGNNATNDPTNAANSVLTSDASGNATWIPLTGNASSAWTYSASRNLKLNQFVLTNNDNSTNITNVKGLRLDASGNVRIGNGAPIAGEGVLQVDGNFVSKYLNSKNVYEPQFTTRNGKVFIGNTSTSLFNEANALGDTYKMIVNGKVRVKDEVHIKPAGLVWPDYVFKKSYPLLPLDELESYIKKEGHLPNMPSAATIENEGIPISEIIVKQQEKIEEITLYILEIKNEIDALKKQSKN